jgi:hypothetical protein
MRASASAAIPIFQAAELLFGLPDAPPDVTITADKCKLYVSLSWQRVPDSRDLNVGTCDDVGREQNDLRMISTSAKLPLRSSLHVTLVKAASA